MEKEPVLPKNIRQIGEISGREKICIEDYVMTCIRKKEPQEEKGYLGIFFGERQETEDSVYVFIRGIFEIPAEIQEEKEREAVRSEYRKYFADLEVQGCCVIGIYPTERMKTLASWIPESGRLIYHLQEQEETLYWVSGEHYKRLRGYFVFYEQNRMMQEYLADVFGDNSVEKESVPDRAIRSFREKVKEKGEIKKGNFLRMASSFFVITVLIIGAIVVNRVEDIRMARDIASNGADPAAYFSAEGGAAQGNSAKQGEEAAKDGGAQEASGSIFTGDSAAVTFPEQTSQGTMADTAANAGYLAAQQAAEEAVLAGSDAFWEEPDPEENTDGSKQQDEQNTPAVSTAADSGDAIEDSEGEPAADSQAEDALSQEIQDTAEEGAAVPGTDAAQDAGMAAVSGADTEEVLNTDAAAVSDADTAEVLNAAAASGADTAEVLNADAAATSGADTAEVLNADANVVSDADMAANPDTNGTAATGDDSAAEETSVQEAAAIRNTKAGYIIKEGDTLAGICGRYYGNLNRLEEICEVNGIENADMILPGQRIVLP